MRVLQADAPTTGATRVDGRGLAVRWREAVARLGGPAAVLAGAWVLYSVPLSIRDGAHGVGIVIQSAFGPVVASMLMLALMTLVEASSLRGRARTWASLAAVMAAAAVATISDIAMMIWSGTWTAPRPWSLPVYWWASFGGVAMICVGAFVVEDARARGLRRVAMLRKARMAAALVVRRTAEVRLQAAQARVDPRFLFDALRAVEHVRDADVAAGNHLLDDLVAYLRAVMPNLKETRSTIGHELEIARLWLGIRRAVARTPERYDIDDVAPRAHDRPFPCMTIVPIVDAMLADAPASSSLQIGVACEGTITRLRICCDSGKATSGEPSALQALRARLAELYGTNVRFAYALDAHASSATIEVDVEEPESDHR